MNKHAYSQLFRIHIPATRKVSSYYNTSCQNHCNEKRTRELTLHRMFSSERPLPVLPSTPFNMMFNKSCFSDGFALRSSITFPPSQFRLRSFSLGQGRPTFVNKLIHCGHVGLELRVAAPHQGVHDRRPVGAESALKKEVAHRLHERMRLFLTLQQ